MEGDNQEQCAAAFAKVEAERNVCSEECVNANPSRCRAPVWPMPRADQEYCDGWLKNGRMDREHQFFDPCHPRCSGIRPYDNSKDWESQVTCDNPNAALYDYVCSTSDY